MMRKLHKRLQKLESQLPQEPSDDDRFRPRRRFEWRICAATAPAVKFVGRRVAEIISDGHEPEPHEITSDGGAAKLIA